MKLIIIYDGHGEAAILDHLPLGVDFILVSSEALPHLQDKLKDDRYLLVIEKSEEISRLQEFVKENREKLYLYFVGKKKLDPLQRLYELEGYQVLTSLKDLKDQPVAKKEKQASNYQVITMVSNPELGLLLASFLAKHEEKKLVVVDADRLNPSLKERLAITGTYSLEQFVEAPGEAKRQAIPYQDFWLIPGSQYLGHYEYFDQEKFSAAINSLRKQFEVVVLLVNSFIYDAYSLLSLYQSDCNLYALRGDQHELTAFEKTISYLEERQEIPRKKAILFLDETMGRGLSPIFVYQYVTCRYGGRVLKHQGFKKMIRQPSFSCKKMNAAMVSELRLMAKKIGQVGRTYGTY